MASVHPRIALTKERLADFCRKWEIVRLELFGSALREDFRDDSDIDVLVTFEPAAKCGIGQHLAMEEELADLLGRPFDVVDRQSIERSKNYLRRRLIFGTAQTLSAG